MHEPNQNKTFKACRVHPALRSLIRHMVIITEKFDGTSSPTAGYFMPSPDQAMFINLYTRLKSKKQGEQNFNRVTSCTLIGAQITPFQLLVEENHVTVSIIFQPGGLNRFLNIPMTELFDNGYSARDVAGREIEDLLDESHHSLTINELEHIVQSYFLSKLSKTKEPLPIDTALQYLLKNPNTSMHTIAGIACMSMRNFERKCKERLGMPAKMYARITRFHMAYKMLEARPAISWTDLAYEAGYFDQAHFIKDFKEFAGLTPTIIQKELANEHIQFQLDWDSL